MTDTPRTAQDPLELYQDDIQFQLCQRIAVLEHEVEESDATANKLLERAREVKGRRDVHSVYEVLEDYQRLKGEVEVLREYAERYRWLCSDPDSREERERKNALLERMATMSYSAATAAIDAARQEKGHE